MVVVGRFSNVFTVTPDIPLDLRTWLGCDSAMTVSLILTYSISPALASYGLTMEEFISAMY